MKEKLNISLDKIDFAVVDLETTGFCHKNDRIVEVAAVRIKEGKIDSDTFQSLVYADYVPYHASRVHGIDAEMLADAPGLNSVKESFNDFVRGCVLVGHNIKSFDLPFLQTSFEVAEDAFCVDTLKLSRLIFSAERRHKLPVVAQRLGIESQRYHRALDDTLTTARVFLELIRMGKDRFKVLKDIIA